MKKEIKFYGAEYMENLARTSYIESKRLEVDKQVQYIEKQIRKAAKAGLYRRTFYYKNIPTSVEKRLIELGYKTRDVIEQQEWAIEVSWENI